MKGLFFTALASGLAVMVSVAGCQKSTVEGPQGMKLTLVKPADQTIEQGQTNKVLVKIDRDKFKDPVKVRFGQLPQGVEVAEQESNIPTDDETATFTLKAAPDAAPVEKHQVNITAEAPNGMKVTEQFLVSVKANDSKTDAAAPPPVPPAG